MSDTTTSSDVEAAVRAGVEIAGPQPVGASERFFTQLVPAGAKAETIDLEQLEEKLAPFPRRKTGTVHVQDAESFIDYIGKHQLAATEVWADLSRMALVGVINSHEASDGADSENIAGHRDHRVSLELLRTDAWKAWTALDKQPLTQQQFAEHIEDRAIDVINPDSATMLEVAQSLIATNGVDFKSAARLADGQVQFRYEETVTARAGQAGELEIPQTFVLGISPFEGCPPVEVTARFRYRISPNGLQLFFALLNPEDVARQAFLDYVDTVAESITPPVFKGRPE